MSSFVNDILEPGGALLLIPYIRIVVGCLFGTTMVAFLMGIARVHMAILSFLGGGLLLSIGFFLGEYETAKQMASKQLIRKSDEKTD